MDQNLPVTAKRFWKIVRVAFFKLRKGLSKRKQMFDLNLLVKRGKIASKAAIQNLMFHHNNNTHGHQCPSSTSSSKEMDKNLPVMAKKFWNIVRVAYFMLRKGLSKRKLMLDLNLLMTRGKIAGKAAIQNLIFHHNHPHGRDGIWCRAVV
nr:uncharacterized protein LOC104103256 [Nicotiana tomentosiformis]